MAVEPTVSTYAFSAKSVNCYGLHLVQHRLESLGIEVTPYVAGETKPVMVSLYWPEQLFDFVKWRFQNSLRGRKIIVGGNFASTSPQAVLPFADAVYIGDGEIWNGDWDSPYVVTKERPATEKAVAPHIIPVPYDDQSGLRRTFVQRSFVEISRGCRNKCLFCQYGWLKPYREADITDVVECIKRSHHTIRVFAADRFQHSQYAQIRAVLDDRGKADTGSDITLRFVLEHPEYLKITTKARVGIEGQSYWLRRLVGKGYSNEQIVEFARLVWEAGIKCFDWYMIYGLPGEDDDVDGPEFWKLMNEVAAVTPENYLIAVHWNSFSPSAMTPFQWASPATAMGPKLFNALNTRIPGKRWYHKPKHTDRWKVILRTLAIRGTDSTKKLVYSIAMNEGQWKRSPETVLAEYKKATGLDLLGEWPVDEPLPWDGLVPYKRDKMLALWRSTQKRVAERNGEP